jgi:sugar phosphate isomerase/epimerase
VSRALCVDDLVLCSGTVRKLGVVDTARVAAAVGYQGISVYVHEVRAALADGWTVPSLRAHLDELGLAVAEIDGAVDWVPGVPVGERAASLDEVVAIAAGLRARSITAVEVSGRLVGDALPFDDAVEGFARFCDLARPHDVLVHIEYFPFSGIRDLTTARAVVHAADRVNGGVLVDIWHHQRGPDAGGLESLQAAGREVVGIQLNDAALVAEADVRHECMHGRTLPGEGHATSAAMVAALRAGGCIAPIGVEVYSDALDALDPEDAARRAMAATRSVV